MTKKIQKVLTATAIASQLMLFGQMAFAQSDQPQQTNNPIQSILPLQTQTQTVTPGISSQMFLYIIVGLLIIIVIVAIVSMASSSNKNS